MKAGQILKHDFVKFRESTKGVSAAKLGRSLGDRAQSQHEFRSFIIGSRWASILEEVQRPEGRWTRSSRDKPRLGFIFTD